MLDNITWNHLTVWKQMSSGFFKNDVTYKLFIYKSYIYIYIKRERELTNCSQENPEGSLFFSYYTKM